MFLLLFLLVPCLAAIQHQPCLRNMTVDISAGVFNTVNKSFTHDGFEYSTDKYFRDGEVVLGCVCLVRTCVKKCCPEGQAKINGSCIPYPKVMKVNIFAEEELVEEDTRYYAIGHRMKCQGYIMQPDLYEEDVLYIQRDGRLYSPGYKYYEMYEYCISFFSENATTLEAHVCEKTDDDEPLMLNAYGMIISIPFLLATFLIYLAILPDRNNIHIKCQMCYVFSLMCAYLFLVCIQLMNLESIACTTLASLCLYAFMSSFCWMNISCCDIFWTFTGKRGFGASSNVAKLKRFAMYCSYAYGFPLALVGFVLGINKAENTNAWFHPNFGVQKCWITNGFPLLLYFYGPMGILLLTNMVLFVLTALKIRQINRDTAMLRTEENKIHYESDKQRFNLYFKLLIAMGINWSLEFISWLVDWSLGVNKISEVWYVTDFCNAIYGVFIFYLFICKRTTWVMMKKRYYVFMGQPQKARALSMRATTTNSETEKTNMDESISTKV